MQINLDDIKVTKRVRKDNGDISSFADNINEIGLLHPIVIDEANELICGHRRVLAFKKLRRKQIPCTKVNLVSMTKGEFSENAYRKDFTFSEMVEIKHALEPEIKREAEIRMKAGKPMPKLGKGRSTEIIAKALGIGHTSLEKVEKLVDAAEKHPEIKKLLDKVDNGKTSLDKAYKQVIKHEKLKELLHTTVTSITDDSIRLILGDMQDESKKIPNNSVGLIFTDPPYAREFLPLYNDLAEVAARVLKDGSSIVTYCGQDLKLQVIEFMKSKGLVYWWDIAVVHNGPFSSFFPKNILVKWKPLLWFVKGGTPHQNGKIFDLIESTRPNKILHEWEQSSEDARYIIELLARPGDTVLDPFMGSGTTGIAALDHKCHLIGIEINPESFELAKLNIAKHLNQTRDF